MELSPATVRNVISDLEDMGLVKSPHTSAGRMPTVQGYRLFIDTMLNVKPLDISEVEALKKQLKPEFNSKLLLKSASTLLSDVTHLAGVVMIPKREFQIIEHVEFLPLSDRRVLVILVLQEGEVQNRVIHTDRDYSQPELQQAANYLNSRLRRHDLADLRDTLKRELQEAQQELSNLMQLVIRMSDTVLNDSLVEGEELLVEGQTNLMGSGDLSDMEKLKRLFEAFNRKRDILHLLDRSQRAEGVQIFIGQESGYEVLDSCSVVTSPYSAGGQVVGVLGVVGPTRMAYDRVIPLVDITAKLLSAALNRT
jgi:heat-inducible transcriptional repressor